MHSRKGHSLPTRSRSTTAVDRPPWAQRPDDYLAAAPRSDHDHVVFVRHLFEATRPNGPMSRFSQATGRLLHERWKWALWPPRWVSRDSPHRERARSSMTRWFSWLISNSSQTSAAPGPRGRRSITAREWGVGPPSRSPRHPARYSLARAATCPAEAVTLFIRRHSLQHRKYDRGGTTCRD